MLRPNINKLNKGKIENLFLLKQAKAKYDFLIYDCA